jgi:glutamyl-tRNA synthetase
MSEAPRVRFAPSPTGYLHVGGARTALFNWLYARHNNGTFVLRVEDTDLERSSEEMVQAITDGLNWLGIDWDEGPLFQGERVGEHRTAADQLLEQGSAYRCFCDPAELEAERKAAMERGDDLGYDGRCRMIDPAEARTRAEGGEPFALRFAVPHDVPVKFVDHIHGPTRVDGEQIEDFVLLRSNGQPTYMLAVVVDDIWSRISLVIRGDDHLSNTPKQILLYRALGAPVPEFAHLPLILGEDKKRLSKRHGAASVGDYRERGFQPEAVLNFLSLLGWSPGEDREFMRTEDLIELFSLERVNKKPAVFDETKLEWLNGQYMIQLPSEELVPNARKAFEEAGFDVSGTDDATMTRIVDLLKERVRLYTDFPEKGPYFFRPPDSYNEESVAKRWKKPDEVIPRLKLASGQLGGLDTWSHDPIESCIRSMAEQEEVGAGKYIHPIRVAVSGTHEGPGLFELLETIGQQESVERLERAIAWLEARPPAESSD